MTDSDAEHDACADFFADADSADADAADSPSYHPLEHLLTVSYLISSKHQLFKNIAHDGSHKFPKAATRWRSHFHLSLSTQPFSDLDAVSGWMGLGIGMEICGHRFFQHLCL